MNSETSRQTTSKPDSSYTSMVLLLTMSSLTESKYAKTVLTTDVAMVGRIVLKKQFTSISVIIPVGKTRKLYCCRHAVTGRMVGATKENPWWHSTPRMRQVSMITSAKDNGNIGSDMERILGLKPDMCFDLFGNCSSCDQQKQFCSTCSCLHN